jgi:serine/threonine-protein kinase HipA
MAQAAGIEMSECLLLEENNRAHFMTKRFDRSNAKKLHMQSLSGIAHYDFNMAGAYSYEQAFAVMRKLHLSKAEAIQQYRRMLFNVIARNQDDHTKNIAFLMNEDGKWRLSPAFDMTYSHNPAGHWTNQHQMSLNGKRDHFTPQDLISVGHSVSINKPEDIIHEVIGAVEQWPSYASEAGLNPTLATEIGGYHRLDFLSD